MKSLIVLYLVFSNAGINAGVSAMTHLFDEMEACQRYAQAVKKTSKMYVDAFCLARPEEMLR